jgi:hypothetical protein
VTAQPTGHAMWSPDPIRQRLAAHTVEDVLKLPEDAPRVELRDGLMVVVPSPKAPFDIRLPIRDITP